MKARKHAPKKKRPREESPEEYDRRVMRMFRLSADRERKIRALARRVIRERKKTVSTLREFGEFALAEANMRNGDRKEAN